MKDIRVCVCVCVAPRTISYQVDIRLPDTQQTTTLSCTKRILYVVVRNTMNIIFHTFVSRRSFVVRNTMNTCTTMNIYSTLFVSRRSFASFQAVRAQAHTVGFKTLLQKQLYPLLLVTRAQHRRFVQTRPFLLNFTCYGPLKKRRGCYNVRQWRRTCFFILSSTFVRCNSHQKISTMLCCCCCSFFFLSLLHTNHHHRKICYGCRKRVSAPLAESYPNRNKTNKKHKKID